MRYAQGMAAAAIAAIGIIVPVTSSQAASRPASSPCPAFQHGSTSGHQSLYGWAKARHSTITETLDVTQFCSVPGWEPRLAAYIDAGNLRAVMPSGIMLWTHPVPPRP